MSDHIRRRIKKIVLLSYVYFFEIVRQSLTGLRAQKAKSTHYKGSSAGFSLSLLIPEPRQKKRETILRHAWRIPYFRYLLFCFVPFNEDLLTICKNSYYDIENAKVYSVNIWTASMKGCTKKRGPTYTLVTTIQTDNSHPTGSCTHQCRPKDSSQDSPLL